METLFATQRRAVSRLARAGVRLAALYHRARLLGAEHLPAHGPALRVALRQGHLVVCYLGGVYLPGLGASGRSFAPMALLAPHLRLPCCNTSLENLNTDSFVRSTNT